MIYVSTDLVGDLQCPSNSNSNSYYKFTRNGMGVFPQFSIPCSKTAWIWLKEVDLISDDFSSVATIDCTATGPATYNLQFTGDSSHVSIYSMMVNIGNSTPNYLTYI